MDYEDYLKLAQATQLLGQTVVNQFPTSGQFLTASQGLDRTAAALQAEHIKKQEKKAAKKKKKAGVLGTLGSVAGFAVGGPAGAAIGGAAGSLAGGGSVDPMALASGLGGITDYSGMFKTQNSGPTSKVSSKVSSKKQLLEDTV